MTWAVNDKGYSQRRACGLVGLHAKTYRYASKRTSDEGLRATLRELASQRRRFGYRRLGLLLARQGVRINHKKLYRGFLGNRFSDCLRLSFLVDAKRRCITCCTLSDKMSCTRRQDLRNWVPQS